MISNTPNPPGTGAATHKRPGEEDDQSGKKLKPSTISTAAKDALENAKHYIRNILPTIKGEISGDLITQSLKVKQVIEAQLKECPSEEVRGQLTSVRTDFVDNMPPIRVGVTGSVEPIELPFRHVDKIITIKSLVDDLSILQIHLENITKDDLINVMAFLDKTQNVTLENWYRFCEVALYLDIPELEAACISFAKNNITINHIKAMKGTASGITQIARMLPQEYQRTLFTQYAALTAGDKATFNTCWLDKLTHITLSNTNDYNTFIELQKDKKLKACNSIKISNITQDQLNLLATHASKIETLDISDCEDIETIPAGFKKLRELIAAESGLTQEALNDLAKSSPLLEKLDITECEGIKKIPAGFKKLRELIAGSSWLTQEGLNDLAEASPLLEKLDISYSAGITTIPAGFTNLRELIATMSELTQEGLNVLAEASPPLESLDIRYLKSIKTIPTGFTNLRELNSGMSGLTQEGLNDLAKSSPLLETLEIYKCQGITKIPTGFTNLRELNSGMSGLTQEGLNDLAKSSPLLETLDIYKCQDITKIPTGFTNLRELVANASGLTQEGLNDLAKSSPLLEKLDISYSVGITTIPAGFTNLRELNAFNSGLTQEGLNALAKSSPLLKMLDIRLCAGINDIPPEIRKIKPLT